MPTTIDGGTGASQIQNGTVTEAKIAAGAVTETKIADGAVTAAKLAVGAISTTSVLAATAGASAGAVGAYCAHGYSVSGDIGVGGTVAGSSLRGSGTANNPGFAGTWRCMGAQSSTGGQGSAWLRIS
jgi:hypothetical protein